MITLKNKDDFTLPHLPDLGFLPSGIPTRLGWQSQRQDRYNCVLSRIQEAWKKIKHIWGIPLSILLLTPVLLLLEGVAYFALRLEDCEYRLAVWVLKRRSI